jgi:hypothetical protein
MLGVSEYRSQLANHCLVSRLRWVVVWTCFLATNRSFPAGGPESSQKARTKLIREIHTKGGVLTAHGIEKGDHLGIHAVRVEFREIAIDPD